MCDKALVTCPGGTQAANLASCPVTCTAGSHKSLFITSGQFPPGGSAPTLFLRKNADGTESVATVPNTVMYGSCVYTIPNSPSLGCQTSASGILYCKVTATATGQKIDGEPDTSLDAGIAVPNSPSTCTSPLVWDVDHCKVPEASPGCYAVMAANGSNEICPENAQKNCGTVNGAQLCVTDKGLTTDGYAAAIIDGQVVGETKNENGQTGRCITTASGKVVCINTPVANCGTVNSIFTCVGTQQTATQPSRIIPLSSDPQQVSSTVTSTSATGASQQVTTTTTDIVGSKPTVTTNNYNAAGQLVSTSTTGGSSGTGIGTSTGAGTTASDGTVSAGPGAYSGQGAFSPNGHGVVDGQHGRFYTSSGKTAASISTAFMSKATASPLFKAGQDVFNVTFPQVSSCTECDFSIPSVIGMSAVEMFPFCAPWMPAFWSFIAAVIKVVAVFMSIRIILSAS